MTVIVHMHTVPIGYQTKRKHCSGQALPNDVNDITGLQPILGRCYQG